MVESNYKNGIELSSDKGEVNIQIFCSSEVTVEILNSNIKNIEHKITKEEFQSHDYNLYIKVTE